MEPRLRSHDRRSHINARKVGQFAHLAGDSNPIRHAPDYGVKLGAFLFIPHGNVKELE